MDNNENPKSEMEQLREIFTKDKTKEPTREQIEEWARQSVWFGEGKSQLALISLLHAITQSADPAGVALDARNAAFARCDMIIDDVIGKAVA